MGAAPTRGCVGAGDDSDVIFGPWPEHGVPDVLGQWTYVFTQYGYRHGTCRDAYTFISKSLEDTRYCWRMRYFEREKQRDTVADSDFDPRSSENTRHRV